MVLSVQYVVFTLDAQRYTLPLAHVERVVPAVYITPLPQAPAIIKGSSTTPMKNAVPAGSPQSRVFIALAARYTDKAARLCPAGWVSQPNQQGKAWLLVAPPLVKLEKEHPEETATRLTSGR